MRFLVCLLVLGSAVCMASGRLEEPIPGKAVAELKLDKDRYFLGEPLRVEFVLRNTDDKDISYNSGGDYRGSGRALRFRVQAVDTAGVAVPDADPAMCFGGMVGTNILKPGEEWRRQLWPLDYLRLTKPGKYTLRVTHDLGWMEQEGRFFAYGRTADTPFVPENWQAPIAEAQVEILPPDKRRAKKILDEIAAEIKRRDNGFIPASRDLGLPVYLPLLKQRAHTGEQFFLHAIGEMPTKDATLVLLALAEEKRFPDDAAAAAYLLSQRMPFPPQTPPNHRDEKHKRLLESAWDESYTPRARKIARRLVSSFNPAAPEKLQAVRVRASGYFRHLAASEFKEVDLGAQMLASVGTAEDYEILRKAFEKAFVLTLSPRRGANANILDLPAPMPDLILALDALYARGLEPKPNLNNNADIYLYFHRLAGTPPPRLAGWLRIAKTHNDPNRYPIQMAIAESIPRPMPPECRDLVRDLLNARDGGVLMKACEAAGSSGDETLLSEVLAIIRKTNNEWVFRSAVNAAAQLGARCELAEALIERLPDEKLPSYGDALGGLIDLVIECLPGNHSGRTDLTHEERLVMQAAWREWLIQHDADIKAGKKFKLGDDANLPRALFGRAISWTLPDGKQWPEEELPPKKKNERRSTSLIDILKGQNTNEQ